MSSCVWMCLLFPVQSVVLIGSAAVPFLSLLNLLAPLAFSQATVREILSSFRTYKMLHLQVFLWVFVSGFAAFLQHSFDAFPDHANPGTLCGCNSYELIRGFWGVNDELQHVSLEDQRLQPFRHWRNSCETKALAYGWCVLSLRSFDFLSDVCNFNLRQCIFFNVSIYIVCF